MSFTTGSSGKAPSLAHQRGRGLINELGIDAEVCEQATCEGCGHKGLELVPTRMRLETTGLRSLCAQSVMRRLSSRGKDEHHSSR